MATSRKRPVRKTMLFFLAAQILAGLAAWAVLEAGMATLKIYLHLLYPVRHADPDLAPITNGGRATPDNYQIVAIGDSHTFGNGAPKGMDYPSQLVRLIRDESGPLTPALVNLAHAGANSSEARRRFESWVSDNSPRMNLVIICIGNNNKQNLDFHGYMDEEVDKLPTRLKLAHFLEHSGAYRLSKVTRARIQQLLAQNVEDTTSAGCVFCKDNEPFLMQWLETDLTAMVRMAKSRNSAVVLVDYFFFIPYVNRTMLNVALNERVLFVDVTHFGLPLSQSQTPYVSKDYHPNEKGAALIARMILKAMHENGIIHAASKNIQATGTEAPPAVSN